MADTLINADPIVVSVTTRGIASHFPPAERNEHLDQTLYLSYPDKRTGLITVTMHGEWLNKTIHADPIEITVSIDADTAVGLLLNSSGSNLFIPITISIGQTEDGEGTAFVSGPVMYTEASRKNWIKWSDIGAVDFTIGRSNVAGERPLDWQGFVYQIRKLAGKLIVYGQGGVSILVPAGIAFGLDTIYKTGLIGKEAVAGDDKKQFFIDKKGQLWKVGDTMKLLDYSEFLSSLLPGVIMSYDSAENLIYICDGVNGFIFNVTSESLGEGPVNITGIGHRQGERYVTASSTVVTDPFEICSDIYDLGLRAGKTVFSLEFGTNLTNALYAAIEYRRDKSAQFASTPWYLVGPTGRVFITAWGREFRFKAKLLTYEAFELDYIKVNGVADAY